MVTEKGSRLLKTVNAVRVQWSNCGRVLEFMKIIDTKCNRPFVNII